MITLPHALSLIIMIFLTTILVKKQRPKRQLGDLLIFLLPIFWFVPKYGFLVYFLPLLTFFLLTFELKIQTKLSIFIITLLFAYSCLVSNGLINPDLTVNKENFWWGKPDIRLEIETLRKQALYLPYSSRRLVFSPLIYLHKIFGASMSLLNPFYLIATVSLVNFYLIGRSIIKIRKPESLNLLALWLTFLALFIAGLSRSPDKFNAFYLLLPVFTYYLWLGLYKVNQKLLLLLTLISLLILPGL